MHINNMIKIDGKKIKQNKLHAQTHNSFSRFKIFIDFYRISTPFILQTRTKTLKGYTKSNF